MPSQVQPEGSFMQAEGESAPHSVSACAKGLLHVLTITPFYPKVGNESGGCFVAEPLAELSKAGVQSSVFAVEPFYRPKPHTSTSSSPNDAWYRYPALPGGFGLASSGSGLFVRLRAPAEKLHARSPIDVIHAHGALPCGHAAELLSRHLKIPFVVTVHGLDAFSSRQVSGWPGAKCVRVSRRVYGAARRVIGVSRRVCDVVQDGTGGISAAWVVYNGVDPSLFTPGSDPAQPVLLSVGNLIPTKGHELIVHTLAALLPEFPDLTWEVIGEGPELNRIRALAERLGVLNSVRFQGRRNRSDVAEACRQCTVFVLPSRYEGLGCVYLEAMASGKVAIGCRGQGIEEIIQHGRNGWLVGPDSVEELAAALSSLLGSRALRESIAAQGRETVLAGFTVRHQAERLAAVYRKSIP
jgi:teichuronic acid biosynthesis glycosyltransferase TuaC